MISGPRSFPLIELKYPQGWWWDHGREVAAEALHDLSSTSNFCHSQKDKGHERQLVLAHKSQLPVARHRVLRVVVAFCPFKPQRMRGVRFCIAMVTLLLVRFQV